MGVRRRLYQRARAPGGARRGRANAESCDPVTGACRRGRRSVTPPGREEPDALLVFVAARRSRRRVLWCSGSPVWTTPRPPVQRRGQLPPRSPRRRVRPRARRTARAAAPRLVVAVGRPGCWAAGQMVWSLEIVLDRGVPFPSLADVGFLVFPLAPPSAWSSGSAARSTRSRPWAGRPRRGDHRRLAADRVVGDRAGLRGQRGRRRLATPRAVLAYPISDLILATLVLLALARGTGSERGTLAVSRAGSVAWPSPTARTSTWSASRPTPRPT